MKDLQGLPTITVNNSTKVLVQVPKICILPVATETLEVTIAAAMGNNQQLNANSNGMTILIGHIERICHFKLK